MAKQTLKKSTKSTAKKKVDKPTAKKAVKKTIPTSKKVKQPKKVIKKSILKPEAKVKKPVKIGNATIIRKTFEKITLVSHKFTKPNDHPPKMKPNISSISEINGIGGNRYMKFYSAGIKTVEDFANAGVSHLLVWRGSDSARWRESELDKTGWAQLLRRNREYSVYGLYFSRAAPEREHE